MKKEIQAKWLKALRSGEYKQGTTRLLTTEAITDAPKFCCLGVLSELYMKDTGKGAWVYNTEDWAMEFRAGDDYSERAVTPTPVAKWAGLVDANPVVAVGGVSVSLAELNDSGYTFEKLADIIEEQL